jgi:hypothetical protein
MRNTTVFSRKYNDLKVLEAGLREEVEARPYIEPFYKELQSVLGEADDVQLRQEATRAQFRELIRQRQEIEARGEAVRSRIAAFLRGELGFRSEQLLRFGIVPLPRTKKRTAETKAKRVEGTEKTPPPETPAPAAEATPTE